MEVRIFALIFTGLACVTAAATALQQRDKAWVQTQQNQMIDADADVENEIANSESFGQAAESNDPRERAEQAAQTPRLSPRAWAPAPSPAPTASIPTPSVPVHGKVWVLFHDPRNPNHQGIDIRAARGTAVKSLWAGRVEIARCESGVQGCVVRIAHGDGLVSLYAHLENAPEVSVGQWVKQGQDIGSVGDAANQGANTDLHLEIRRDGEAQDPLRYLRQR